MFLRQRIKRQRGLLRKNDKSPNTGDEAPIDFVVMLIMASGLGIITQKRRSRV